MRSWHCIVARKRKWHSIATTLAEVKRGNVIIKSESFFSSQAFLDFDLTREFVRFAGSGKGRMEVWLTIVIIFGVLIFNLILGLLVRWCCGGCKDCNISFNGNADFDFN
jgi:hypothetical protein